MLIETKPGSRQPEASDLPLNHFQTVCTSIVNKIAVLANADSGISLIQNRLKETSKPVVLSFLNAHGFNMCLENQSFYQAVMASDIVLRDGAGMKILFSLLGKDPGENMNGTDFIPFILDRLNNQTIALVGTRKDVLLSATNHPSLKRHDVVYLEEGFLPLKDYLLPVVNARPDVILLGMGMPKQEELSFLLKGQLPGGKLIINGGAIIDFMGNKVPRAPLFIRKVGMEWLFRLMLEPRRLFNRYVIGNFVFMNHALKMYRAIRK